MADSAVQALLVGKRTVSSSEKESATGPREYGVTEISSGVSRRTVSPFQPGAIPRARDDSVVPHATKGSGLAAGDSAARGMFDALDLPVSALAKRTRRLKAGGSGADDQHS